MRRTQNAPAFLYLSLALLSLGGCSDDKPNDTIQTSPEAKKADEGAQKGMNDFMQTKGKAKTK